MFQSDFGPTSSVKVQDEVYEFIAGSRFHNKNITCELHNGDFLMSKNCSVFVDFAPDFGILNKGKTKNTDVKHGNSLKLICEFKSNPTASVRWFFGIDKKSLVELENKSQSLEIPQASHKSDGVYECRAENSIGQTSMYFRVWRQANSECKYDGQVDFYSLLVLQVHLL